MMEISAQRYVHKLIECSKKKHALLKEVYRLTEAQANCLNEDGVENLDAVISERQQRMDEVDRIDADFKTYFQRLKSELGVSSLDEFKDPASVQGMAELKQIVNSITELLHSVMELDQKNAQEAKVLLDSLAGEVRKASQSRKVQNTYNSGAIPDATSFYFDKKK